MASRLFIGSDHAGFPLKAKLFTERAALVPGVEWVDLGTDSAERSVDYPTYARKVAAEVAKGHGLGILVCGSGIGVSIAANRVKGVRAALAWDMTSARLSREHNDANILCLGARLIGETVAQDVVKAWWTATFQGGRYQMRVQRIDSEN